MTATGLVLSPAPFSIGATPKGLVDKSYCIEVPASADTGKYREGGDDVARLAHTVVIRLAKMLKPSDQFASQLDGLDIEEKVIAVMLRRDQWGPVRVSWASTSRSLTAAREHVISELSFQVEHDWSFETA